MIGCRSLKRRLQIKLLIIDAPSSLALLICRRLLACIFSRKLKFIASLGNVLTISLLRKLSRKTTPETGGVLRHVRIAKWRLIIK